MRGCRGWAYGFEENQRVARGARGVRWCCMTRRLDVSRPVSGEQVSTLAQTYRPAEWPTSCRLDCVKGRGSGGVLACVFECDEPAAR